MSCVEVIHLISSYVWSTSFLLFFFGLCVYVTVQLGFVQFRCFFDALKFVFVPHKREDELSASGNLSPFQAFMNTMGASIGNGSLAGVPVAIHLGGPGSVFWLLLMSTFAIALRYAEVFLGTYIIGKSKIKKAHGGPMAYLSLLPGGNFLAHFFTVFCLGYLLVCSNVAQSHAVGFAIQRSWGVDPLITGFFVLAFILYVVIGGSHRIVKLLDKLVPFKVFGFFVSALIILLYHYKAVPGALYLIGSSAFQPQALLGGSLAFALQKVIGIGFQQGIFAHEAGLGTAAVAFGTTEGKDPEKNGIMSMLSVYINTHIVCLMVALSVVASGVWNNGETSSALLISAYETVFGRAGGLIVTLLVMSFALSVVVAAAFTARVCWNFLFNNRFESGFMVVFVGLCFWGTWMDVGLVWCASSLINAVLFAVNLVGIVWSIGIIKSRLSNYLQHASH